MRASIHNKIRNIFLFLSKTIRCPILISALIVLPSFYSFVSSIIDSLFVLLFAIIWAVEKDRYLQRGILPWEVRKLAKRKRIPSTLDALKHQSARIGAYFWLTPMGFAFAATFWAGVFIPSFLLLSHLSYFDIFEKIVNEYFISMKLYEYISFARVSIETVAEAGRPQDAFLIKFVYSVTVLFVAISLPIIVIYSIIIAYDYPLKVSENRILVFLNLKKIFIVNLCCPIIVYPIYDIFVWGGDSASPIRPRYAYEISGIDGRGLVFINSLIFLPTFFFVCGVIFMNFAYIFSKFRKRSN